MNQADIYGRSLRGAEAATAPQSAVATGAPKVSPSPALFWVAMVAVLVAVRMLYELAE